MVEDAIKLAEAHLRDIKPGENNKSNKIAAGESQAASKKNGKKGKPQSAEERIKVLKAEVADTAGDAGTTLDERLTIGCGDKALRPTLVQRAGKPKMDVGDFLRGSPIAAGTKLA